ncbi:MAG TPA: nicotinamide-nucleotide amidohydrolase family protein [Burkholderiales bacterium]|nr:nicotinamide-nucleotide amidohydrolase family protein [Burkholderiales bacterium]
MDTEPDTQLSGLAVQVAQAFTVRRWKLTTVESCTGGWVAQALTAISGSSAWFDRGLVTYSNEAKQDLVGVKTQTLADFGAVSEETAREMAAGALSRSRAQAALSITGIAGPTGGTPDKPVGMVCFAWAIQEGAAESRTQHFKGDRESIRRQAVIAALQGLLSRLPD